MDAPTATKEDPRRLLWRPLAWLLFGSLSVVLLLSTDQLRQHQLSTDAESLLRLAHLRTEVALAHLWLEEYVSGDAEVQADQVRAHLEDAHRFLEELSAHLPRASKTLQEVETLSVLLGEFNDLAIERRQGVEKRLPVGIGSALDREYDEVFERLLSHSTSIQEILEKEAAARRSRSRAIFLSITVGWSLLVLGAALGAWGREKQRKQSHLALEKSRLEVLESQKLDAVGRLAGGLAHDINNYLAAIRGHSELVLLAPPSPEKLQHKMRAVLRTVEKATALLDRLLTFSRRRPTIAQAVDLNRILRGLEKMMGPTLGESIRVDLRLAPDLPPVLGDPAQFEQMIVNLWMNARDAMMRPSGGPGQGLLTVETTHDTAEGRSWVVLRVQDQGCGIPAEELEHIFEPFWTTRRDQGGSGLGLAVVYGVVQQSGGEITVQSASGHGTTFEIRLPKAPASAGTPEPEHIQEEELGGDGVLLLVDDNEEFRSAIAALLEALGYQVIPAEDGHRALELFEHLDHDVDAVLTDLVMPGMDGHELVQHLRRHQADLPAIFLSGHGEEGLRKHGLDPNVVQLPKAEVSAHRMDGLLHELLQTPSSSVHVGNDRVESSKARRASGNKTP